MKIGINWNSYSTLDEKVQARLIVDNGFDNTFLTLNGEDFDIEKIFATLKEYNIECENIHAPFKNIGDMWLMGENGEKMLAELIKTVELCATYEIPTIIVHPLGRTARRINDIGYERFYKLMESAKRNGVIVAYENIRYLSNLAFLMEEFPEAKFCWDVGHEDVFSTGINYMPLYGDRLGAIHIQDNEMIYDSDLHLIPYDGKKNFDYVAKEIAKVEYNGSLMLEVLRRCSHYYDTWSPEEYFNHAAKAAMRLKETVEKCKGEN